MRLRSGDKHYLRKSADRKAQIRKTFVPLTGRRLICAFRSADLGSVYPPSATSRTNSFFLFPIVFGINRTGQDLVICLWFSITHRTACAI